MHLQRILVTLVLVIFSGFAVESQLSGKGSVHTSVACTNIGHYDIILDCREHGGIINIMWNENITFYGQKNSSEFVNCTLRDDSCTASLIGTGMESRLQALCDGQVRCIAEMEQAWIPENCGGNTLNYMEVTYVCFQPDDMYPALACEDNPYLVFDCERFNQVIVIQWNQDFSYFGRQDLGDDECILEQGSCKIPLTDNDDHVADLSQCEGEGYCIVEYGKHDDVTCGGVTNYEHVIYECEDTVTTSQPRRPTTINDVFDKTTQSLVISTDKGDLVTDVVEPMTTHIPPITQGLVDGCQDLSGQWSSKHTSERLALNHNEDDSVDGLYNSCANCGWLGVEGRKATRESTLGLLVIGQGGDVVISWAGQCYVCGDEEVIHFHRLNYDIDQGSDVACDNDSSDTFTEETVFYRD